MTDEYFDNVVKTKELFGNSAFLCKTCCKVVTKVQKGMKELEGKMKNIEKENSALCVELEALKAKVGQLEGGVKSVETGLVKAKDEVREEVKSELEAKEARTENIVIFGLEESKKDEAKERVKDDERKVTELMQTIDVPLEEGVSEVKFRAGKK